MGSATCKPRVVNPEAYGIALSSCMVIHLRYYNTPRPLPLKRIVKSLTSQYPNELSNLSSVIGPLLFFRKVPFSILSPIPIPCLLYFVPFVLLLLLLLPVRTLPTKEKETENTNDQTQTFCYH